ncbi:MAG TPA: efflux RND transporter periplasmic adaptor subunit, partial [Anaerolineaceae bacterium]|nr:efflux RND transporter periplasmic adaptor subunit [Anaerolineaceae bacterium]
RKAVIVVLILFVVLGAGVLIYSYLNNQNTATETTQQASYNTTTVRRGSLVLSASGSGTLVPGREASLAFPIAGTLAEVDVQVGDQVEKDQQLARLEDIQSLQVAVDTQALALAEAQQALINLQDAATMTLANAQQVVYDAQQNLASTKADAVNPGYMRCSEDTTNSLYYTYQSLQERLDTILSRDTGNEDYYYNQILPAKDAVQKAWANYQYCLGYTNYEVESSQVALTLVQEALRKAQSTLDSLTQNGGIDPIEKMQAELKVSNAKLAYEQAQKNLAEAVMSAPFTGTVLTVGGETGDTVGTAAFITLADLVNPKVDFSVDETDMDMVKVGALAEVTFDAMPDKIFTGTVITVNPFLSTTGGYKVLSGVIRLNLNQQTNIYSFMNGLNASVEIISGKAENALLVPVEALRDLGDGTYGVFVMTNGEPRLKVVEVGLMDSTYAEIKSGLNQGDMVTTGLVETN